MKITANSLEGQLSQLDKQFLNVEATAHSFEQLNGKAIAILHNALEHVYTFGEALVAIKKQNGVNVAREFLLKHSIPYNSRTQANIYIGLVKLAFKNSGDSSRSQYATVLAYASSLGKSAAEFLPWLTEKDKGIEGRRKEAVEAQANSSTTRRNQGRATRIQQAVTLLEAKPMSGSVALPAGVQAPEGFALVLAKIDGSNGAQIVDIVDTDAAKLEPVLLTLAGQAPAQSTEPLAPFFRALDLILSTTPDKIDGKPRDILIANRVQRGKQVAAVEAISEAYSFPGASMSLDTHVGDLPEDEAFVLGATDAKHLHRVWSQHENWTLDSEGELNADGLQQPIQLVSLPTPGNYRVATPKPTPGSPLKSLSSDLQGVIEYLEREKADFKRKNERRNETRPFPGSLNLLIHNKNLSVQLPSTTQIASVGETGAQTDFDGRTLAVNDVEKVAETLTKHHIDANGWIMDGQVEGAGLVLEVHFDNDLFRIVMPTRTGEAYNQVCEALVL